MKTADQTHTQTAPLTDKGVRASNKLLEFAFQRYGPRDFEIRFWNGEQVPASPGVPSRYTIVLNEPGVLRRALLPPDELALGEAFLDGEWGIEGDPVAAMRLGEAITQLQVKPRDYLSLASTLAALPGYEGPHTAEAELPEARQQRPASDRPHSLEGDRRAISYHYDVSNDFFRLFLGESMNYSCAYFRTGNEGLDEAQSAKMRHICDKLRLEPSDRLLDVGCGWGGLLIYAARNYGVSATGITLSEPQALLAQQLIQRAGLSDRVEVKLLDYRKLATLGSFNKVVSVGMVEHVGRSHLPEYFRNIWEVLEPGGLFVNHAISNGPKSGANAPTSEYGQGKQAFMTKYVFPDGELHSLAQMLAPAEELGFEVRDVECLREHYALTLRRWLNNLEAAREQATAEVGKRTVAGCAHAFETGTISLHQSLLAKPDNDGASRAPLTRDYLYRHP